MPWYKDKNGQPVWIDNAAPRMVPVGPQNPTLPYQAPQAAETLRGTQLNNQGQAITNNRTSALTPFDVEKARLESEKLRMELDKLRREEAANNPLTAGGGEIKREALKKLGDIDTLRQKLNSGFAPVGGLLTPVMGAIPGTAARDVVSIGDRVTKAGALAKILDMTRATGKNPFTPMSNSDVQLIADTEGSLNPTVSRPEFERQLQSYQDAYVRAYAGASGNEALGSEIERQFEKYVRENPRSTPAQRQAFRTVLESQARKNYDKRMTGIDFTSGQKKSAPAANGAKFLGFE